MSDTQNIRQDGLVDDNDSGISIGEMLNVLRMGDAIIPPVELNKTIFIQIAKYWPQIPLQSNIGLAGMKKNLVQ